MKNLETNLNNLNHNLYIGMDTHHKDWNISIYSDEFELKTYTTPPSPELLAKQLRSNYPGYNYYCVYEAGFGGFWIQRSLDELGIPCIVTNPADVPTKDKERKRKTDPIDSRKLARGLRSKEIEGIYIPTVQQEADRLLLRTRNRIVKDQTRIKNRIKSILKLYNISIDGPNNWSKKYVERLQLVELPNAYVQYAFNSYIKEYLNINEQEKLHTKKIGELSKEPRYKKDITLLTTIPSISLRSGMVLLTELMNITRFKTLNHLYSYFGLTPNVHSSSDKEYVGRMTRRGNNYLKSIIIECAWMALRKDPALLNYYKKLLVRMNGNKAIIKVARKLVNRIRFVLINKVEYKLNIN